MAEKLKKSAAGKSESRKSFSKQLRHACVWFYDRAEQKGFICGKINSNWALARDTRNEVNGRVNLDTYENKKLERKVR